MAKTGVIVLTGEGKGKTTAALGVAVRFLGQEKKVRVIQFLKGGGFSGELWAARRLGETLSISQFGGSCRFSREIKCGILTCQKCGECFRASRDPINGWARKAMDAAWAALAEDFSLIILDEVAHALRRGLLPEEEVLAFLDRAAPRLLVILTGRFMPAGVIGRADAATECLSRKHPKNNGVEARRGVEY
jgi:cob(I)alamin adenosyltransferase